MKNSFLLMFISIFLTSCATKVFIKKITVKGDIKLCLVGDTGTGKKEQYQVADAMDKSNCSFVIIAGDLIYPFGLQNEDDLQFFKKFKTPYQKLFDKGVNFLLIDGNHDTRNLTLDNNPWFKLSEKYKQIYFPSMHWKYVINDICFLAFNPKLYRYKSSREFFRSVNNADCAYKVAVNHYPYLSTMNHGDARGLLRHFLKNYIIGSYDLLLAGHDHGLSYEGKHLGTHLLVSGSGAKVRKFKKRASTPFAVSKLGYVLMKINTRNIVYEYRDISNNTLYKFEDKI